MEIGIWAAVAVALVVLARQIWVMSQRQVDAEGRVEPAVAGESNVDGVPVVPRSQRWTLAQVGSVEPMMVAHDLEQPFAANEELDTLELVVPVVAKDTKVVALPVQKAEAVVSAAEDDGFMDDDYIDPIAMSASQSKVVEAQDYIVLYITAGRVPFDGERLLKAISGYGLRFGEMGMFHRHEHPNGHGQVLFSMARVDDVGAFDLEAMGSEFISSVTLFMALPNQQPYLAYDMMIDTAKRLAHEFCGQVLDQNQNTLNRQLIEHYREHVVEFTRRHLMSVAV
jgi:cell division protein ZipA